MKLPAKLKQQWQKEINESGISKLSKEAGVDHRTIRTSIRVGDCRGDVFDKVNAAILRLRNTRRNNPIVKKLIESDYE